MGDNKTYWKAMDLFGACLRGEISNEQLEADPAWQWFQELQKKQIERDRQEYQVWYNEQASKAGHEGRANKSQRIDDVLQKLSTDFENGLSG